MLMAAVNCLQLGYIAFVLFLAMRGNGFAKY